MSFPRKYCTRRNPDPWKMWRTDLVVSERRFKWKTYPYSKPNPNPTAPHYSRIRTAFYHSSPYMEFGHFRRDVLKNKSIIKTLHGRFFSFKGISPPPILGQGNRAPNRFKKPGTQKGGYFKKLVGQGNSDPRRARIFARAAPAVNEG